MKKIIEFISVSKSFDGESAAIRDLDLAVDEGEFLTLLGPSGSGKTTTLMMLAGFESVTAGEILAHGRPISHMPPHRRNLGMVFQNYALFPHMTVADNIRFPLKVRGMSRAEMDERLSRALAMVSLERFGERRTSQLSGGQQQRVAIARALVFGPSIVLMDEPLGALDKQLREQMQYEIKQLHARLGVTFLYVTHDQTEALTISDRIAVFRDGLIEQLDTPSGLYEAPRSSFVAGFIGENNSLPGRILSRSGRRCRVSLDLGTETEATIAEDLSLEDGRTTLSIRPERILVNADASEASTRLSGTVREVTYLGDHRRVHVDVGDRVMVVKIAGPRMPALRAGEAVALGWNAQDCHALDFVQ